MKEENLVPKERLKHTVSLVPFILSLISVFSTLMLSPYQFVPALLLLLFIIREYNMKSKTSLLTAMAIVMGVLGLFLMGIVFVLAPLFSMSSDMNSWFLYLAYFFSLVISAGVITYGSIRKMRFFQIPMICLGISIVINLIRIYFALQSKNRVLFNVFSACSEILFLSTLMSVLPKSIGRNYFKPQKKLREIFCINKSELGERLKNKSIWIPFVLISLAALLDLSGRIIKSMIYHEFISLITFVVPLVGYLALLLFVAKDYRTDHRSTFLTVFTVIFMVITFFYDVFYEVFVGNSFGGFEESQNFYRVLFVALAFILYGCIRKMKVFPIPMVLLGVAMVLVVGYFLFQFSSIPVNSFGYGGRSVYYFGNESKVNYLATLNMAHFVIIHVFWLVLLSALIVIIPKSVGKKYFVEKAD